MSDQQDCPKCHNTPKHPLPPSEVWPTREAIAAHQGGVGRWLVTDPYGVKTLGAFDGDTFHVLARWPVVGAMASEPTQPWKFEPYWKDTFTDEINRQRDRRGAPPAATDSPGQPQAPTPPENPAAEPGIAPGGVDAAGFGSWPSEEEIEAHGNGLWLIRQKGDMAPGQIRSMALGRFGKEEGRTVWWSGGRFSDREHMSAWTFCPIDDNGDKLDAAPVLRGEDTRQLVEQLGRVAPPEEIARRREEARRHLAELDRSVSRMRADARALDKGVLVSKLGDEIQVDGFKDEHIRLALKRETAHRILATLPDRSPDRRVLVVLRGLPGSGKSTVAQAIVDSDPGRWVRVSKDDIRQMMVGPNGDLFRFVEDRAREVVVAKTADEMAMSALRLGLDVVVDATNLTNKALNSWRITAMVVNRDGHGPVLVCERAVPTPVEECVARDARRGARSVGRAVIERLAATIDVPLADRNQEVGQ